MSTAMSVACQVNWASNFVVGLGWPYLNKALGPYSFGPFGLLLLGTFLFTWGFLPETAGRSIAEVQRAAQDQSKGGRWGGGAGAKTGGMGMAEDGNPRGPKGNGIQYVVVEGVDLSLNTSP